VPQITGIVLAGGRATRFGSDKMAAIYRGQPLVHHAALVLAQICDDVVVVLAPGADATGLPPGIRTAHDTTEGEGPLAGLHTGLLAAVRSDVVIVAGGDMPTLRPQVLTEMMRVLDDAGVDAVVLHDGENPRPLPCVLRTWPAAEMTHALLHAGRRRLRDLIDALRSAVIDEATWIELDPDRRSLFDVDEPADLSE
jgi:molybdopterin-guanine dinucleotide biosynthesis protein A